MYEKKPQKLIPREKFIARLFNHAGATLILTLSSLLVGIEGYHYFEGLSWIDSLLNASMILGGMGEISPHKTDAGKIFASIYALYAGFFMMVCTGLLLAPVFHRILHHFHADK